MGCSGPRSSDGREHLVGVHIHHDLAVTEAAVLVQALVQSPQVDALPGCPRLRRCQRVVPRGPLLLGMLKAEQFTGSR
jgi:hypothetical protein